MKARSTSCFGRGRTPCLWFYQRAYVAKKSDRHPGMCQMLDELPQQQHRTDELYVIYPRITMTAKHCVLLILTLNRPPFRYYISHIIFMVWQPALLVWRGQETEILDKRCQTCPSSGCAAFSGKYHSSLCLLFFFSWAFLCSLKTAFPLIYFCSQMMIFIFITRKQKCKTRCHVLDVFNMVHATFIHIIPFMLI